MTSNGSAAKLLKNMRGNMSQKKYIVDLSDEEIQELEQVIRSGKHSARKLTRAH
ncbi:MAG: hypothetical protein HC852_15165, partial [Acaryochloridaceae cyanobacterium RU_4_10]|nr:hypothetical protein [Acaryochloridaceae cyanobacterium RU_4_10]